jgi:putative lipoprotein
MQQTLSGDSLMKPRVIMLLLGGTLLSGCQLLANPKQHEAQGERLQGELRFDAGYWQLTDCNNQKTLVLEFAEPWLQATTGCQPGRPCFADLELQQDDNLPIQVSKVHRIQNEGHGCNDEEFEHLLIRASGNEPFWTIRLNAQGLVLQQPGKPTVALPYIHEQSGDGMQYITSQANNHTLQLWISQHPCIDSMSGAWHAYSARLQWQGEMLTGCAYHGLQSSVFP